MAQVLEIDSLLESPLADLHALAGELEIEGYRLLRKTDLTIAILQTRGADADAIRPAVEAKASELAEAAAARQAELDAQEAEREAAAEAARAVRRQQSGSGGRGGRDRSGRERRERGGRGGSRGERRPRERGERTERGGRDSARAETTGRGRGRDEGSRRERPRRDDRAPRGGAKATESVELVAVSGVFEPGSGGGGRLRTDLSKRVKNDVEVMRTEVRKWRLHRGDVVTGQAKKARRGRTDFQLVSIDAVNGLGEQQRAAAKVKFSEAPSAIGSTRFARKTFKHAPIHSGSRVVITGPTRAAASEMARKLAEGLEGDGVDVVLAVAALRPGQDEGSAKYPVLSGDPGKPPEAIVGALELALERAKRLAESGHNAAVVIDGLDLIGDDKAFEVFSSARALNGGGSLTVAGSAGAGSTLETQASTIAVVAGGRRLKLDKKASWSAGA